MKTCLRSVCIPSVLFVSLILLASAAFAGKDKTEDEFILELSSPKDSVVTKAMMGLEKKYPRSTKATPLIKSALTDPRPEVRRKAARVLGIWQTELSPQEIQNICAMLTSQEPGEVIDALKSLGGLRAKSAVPAILHCLKHTQPNVIRDACRALAEIGDKSAIPAIEPLTSSTNPKIKEDAEVAIYKLK